METIPLTLKGAGLSDLYIEALALAARMLVAMTFAVRCFRRTLDWGDAAGSTAYHLG